MKLSTKDKQILRSLSAQVKNICNKEMETEEGSRIMSNFKVLTKEAAEYVDDKLQLVEQEEARLLRQ